MNDSVLPAIGLRLLSVALFACMNVGIKLAENGGAALGEILFFRQLGASALVTAVVLAGPGIGSLRSRRMGAHASRAAVGLTSMAFTFAALFALPLAEATTIGFPCRSSRRCWGRCCSASRPAGGAGPQ